MLYQLEWRNTSMELVWVSMITMQFPLKENWVVKQNVVYDLSLLDNSKKWGLWDHKWTSIQKKYAVFLTIVYNQYRIFELSGYIV